MSLKQLKVYIYIYDFVLAEMLMIVQQLLQDITPITSSFFGIDGKQNNLHHAYFLSMHNGVNVRNIYFMIEIKCMLLETMYGATPPFLPFLTKGNNYCEFVFFLPEPFSK